MKFLRIFFIFYKLDIKIAESERFGVFFFCSHKEVLHPRENKNCAPVRIIRVLKCVLVMVNELVQW